ncbi:MAG: nucleotide exchange factor GrpE [Dehalococcoidia bacterium]|nr:nucleotide exchange factor GrpE [Dehalococcoidia bacterium]
MTEEEKLSNNEITEEEVEIEDIEALRQSFAKEKEKAEKYLTNWQRSQADFINYKKRNEQEKKEMAESINSMLISNLLLIVDDMERAFVSLPSQLMEFGWIDGIKLIYNKLKAILEAQGLTEIKAKGELFDPHLHEAVTRREGEEGIVIEEIQKGYRLKDKVIRPTMVIVGKGKEEKKIEQENQKEE